MFFQTYDQAPDMGPTEVHGIVSVRIQGFCEVMNVLFHISQWHIQPRKSFYGKAGLLV